MGANSDVPRINRGLAKYEADYYAILGVPLTADSKGIRRGYLQAAKSLHPDRFVGNSDAAERANLLFAKMVSPANEILSKDRERGEYEAVIKMRIKRLLEAPPPDLWPHGEAVRGLAESANWQEEYIKRVQQLSAEQYNSMEEILSKTEQLSELNLAYLLLKAGYKGIPTSSRSTSNSSTLGGIPPRAAASTPPISPRVTATPATSSAPSVPTVPTEPPAPKLSPSETRFLQALDMIERKQYRDAVQYLNFAISAEPNVARYYLHRGIAHLKQGNTGMAKADFLQVTRLEPTNPELMLEVRRWMQQTGPQQPVPGTAATRQTGQAQKVVSPPPKKDDNSGGFLGRLFGKKK
ncbi:J domain-containing protein [Thermostichus vulcanus]|uniref:DnaJ domain-containing protein n=1 Tax=Thermostichus vulcanus str. 'Rupite' TaxID=2813851 RepID=A0ABT0CC76_THEVL|nr:DnaJ domain-containing protein [Thermostichus vulcanus]MCJ2543358.1 DnaJ domain-containing protein [Thermostichus vulcanus str. 'Rupite']